MPCLTSPYSRPLAIELHVPALFFNLSVLRLRSVLPILAHYPKDLTVIGLFDFLEWNEVHIVATILRRLSGQNLIAGI